MRMTMTYHDYKKELMNVMISSEKHDLSGERYIVFDIERRLTLFLSPEVFEGLRKSLNDFKMEGTDGK